MAKKEIIINCANNNQKYTFDAGTKLADMLTLIGLKTEFKIVSAKVNNKVEDLDYRAYSNKTVEFITLNSSLGIRTYTRSLCFILAKAVDSLFPDKKLVIEHAVCNGYFCKIGVEKSLTETDVKQLKDKMLEYVKKDAPFVEYEEETKDVAALFQKSGHHDKALLLDTLGSLYSKYYELDGYFDYFYGALVPSAGFIDVFDLKLYKDGLLLQIPKRSNPCVIDEMIDQPKLYQAYRDQLDLLNVLNLKNVGDLNKAIQEDQFSNIIKLAEAMQERSVAKIAEQVATQVKENDVHVVMIAGPSSSGKTTFRMRLEIQLLVNLVKPIGISLDDYFVNRDTTPRDEKGDYDYESLYALDLKQFNEDLSRILKGEEVNLPTYNFKTGLREYDPNKKIKMTKGDVIIIEGIHGLNPELTASIPFNQKFNIYISALTAVSLDDHNWIPTSDNRLLRRMIRDYKYRNYSPVETIKRWASVRAGEDKWIFPYQENADVMFNSAMIYELAALRAYAEPILRLVPNSEPEYVEAHRLLKFLSYFNYVGINELPPTSLLREFLGGSSFQY